MTLHIGLAGDVMIGRLVDEYGGPIWGDMLPVIKECDFTLINLEAALTHSQHIVPKVFNFKSNLTHVSWLKEALIDAVNLANNHVLDYDVEGLLETLTTLDKADILHVGGGRSATEAKAPAIKEIKGITIGILGITDNEPGWRAGKHSAGINFVEVGDVDAVKEDILALRKKVDILIVSQHIGPNMVERPSKSKVHFAHALIDLGVDIIHSHSAHIFQGVEVYKKKLILYDSGDFVDDYYVDPHLRNDRTFFFRVDVDKNGPKKLTLIPALISNFQVNHAKGEDKEACLSRMIALSGEFGTTFDVTDLGLELYF